jgi:hypothetical protein
MITAQMTLCPIFAGRALRAHRRQKYALHIKFLTEAGGNTSPSHVFKLRRAMSLECAYKTELGGPQLMRQDSFQIGWAEHNVHQQV